MKNQALTVLFTSLTLLAYNASAETRTVHAAIVDGHSISTAMLKFLGQSRTQGPLSNMQQSQAQILDDLITTELLAQAAIRESVDTLPNHQLELELARKTLLAQMYVKQFMAQATPSEEEIKKAYHSTPDQVMVQMGYWEFGTQKQALEFLSQQHHNAQLAPKDEHIMPWQPLDSLPFANLAINQGLTQGDWLNEVIETGTTWRVWRCMNYSKIEKPPYPEARDAIIQDQTQQLLSIHIEALRNQAEIVIASESRP